MDLKHEESRKEPFKKIITSSTNKIWESTILSVIETPSMAPVERTFFNSLVKPSIIRRNNKGEIGHPCLSHLSVWKKPKAAPLTRTLNDIEVKQHIIQLIKG